MIKLDCFILFLIRKSGVLGFWG
ncbi:MAG: hypothetical protein RLZ87_1401, partial [Armatimonadota bacterium]